MSVDGRKDGDPSWVLASTASGEAAQPAGLEDTAHVDDARGLAETATSGTHLTKMGPGPGSPIGRFVIDHRLGGGAMGVVYAAHDPQLDRRVAIKVIKASTRYPDLQDRLRREAQSLARIAHPNVVVVHEVGDHHGEIYLAMELVVGRTLREWLATPHTQPEVLDTFRQAALGLAAAHAAGLIHRDFKPDNVLVGDDGRVRVTDFGLARVDDGSIDVKSALGAVALTTPTTPSSPSPARALSSSAPSPLELELTATGAMVGTPLYAAPEQLTADGPTAASDQFSFCVALYEALYGQHPYGGTTLAELIERTTTGKIVATPPDIHVEPAIDAAVRRGLSPRPADRFPSMNALITALAPATPRPKGRLLLAIPLGLAAIGATALLLRGHHAESCRLDKNKVAAVWTPAKRTQLAEHITTGVDAHTPRGRLRDSVIAYYDAYANELATAIDRTCGTLSTDAAVARLRIACLDRRVGELRVSVDAIVKLEPKLAWSYAHLLSPVRACDAVAVGQTAEPYAVLQQAVLATRADFDARKFTELTKHLEAALRAHPEPALAASRVQLMIQLSQAESFSGHPAEAVRWLEAAVLEAGDDHRLRAQAAAKLAMLHAGLGSFDRVRAALEAVTGANIELDIELEADVAVAQGHLAKAAGQRDLAITTWERAIALYVELGDPGVSVLSSLEAAYRAAGRTQDADHVVERTYAALDNPEFSKIADDAKECTAALAAGELERLRTICAASVESASRIQVLAGLAVGSYLTIGHSHELDRVDLGAAKAAYHHAIELAALHHRESLPEALEAAARVELDLGDVAAAVNDYRDSVTAAGELGAAGEVKTVFARYGLGRALLESGDIEGARVELEWALPRLETTAAAGRITLGAARIALADAVWKRNQGNDRHRARLLALTAQDDLVAHRESIRNAGPLEKYFVAAADRTDRRITDWLAAHR